MYKIMWNVRFSPGMWNMHEHFNTHRRQGRRTASRCSGGREKKYPATAAKQAKKAKKQKSKKVKKQSKQKDVYVCVCVRTELE